MSPSSPTRSLFVDNDTMLIDDTDLDEISHFSKNTRENTGLFDVLSMFETFVSRSSWWFCSPSGRQRKLASGNRLLDRERGRGRGTGGSVISVASSMSKKSRRNNIRSHSLRDLSENSILINKISENMVNEELNKLLLVKIQFKLIQCKGQS